MKNNSSTVNLNDYTALELLVLRISSPTLARKINAELNRRARQLIAA